MVADQHKVTGMEGTVYTAGSIRQEQDLRSHEPHKPCGKYHIAHRISLIEMNAALHNHHRNAVYITENKPALVSRHCGHRKPFNIFVVNGLGNLYLLRISDYSISQFLIYLNRKNGNFRQVCEIFTEIMNRLKRSVNRSVKFSCRNTGP